MRDARQHNLIREIHIARPDQLGEACIRVGIPQCEQSGHIAVVCGRNNSGKSHLIRQAFGSIIAHNNNLALPTEKQVPIGLRTAQHRSVAVTLSYPQEPCASIYSFETYHQVINKPSVTMDVELDGRTYVERPILRACLAAACRALPGYEGLEDSAELPARDVRIALTEEHLPNERARRIATDSSLLQEFERLVGSALYVSAVRTSKHPQCMFHQRHSSGLLIPFPNWSLGQQVLFCYLCVLQFESPAILLLDEPDHALHPLFMTELLAAAKRRCRQVLVATHHPHLIFSKYVDEVWFLDNMTPAATSEAPKVIQVSRFTRGGTPRLPINVEAVSSEIEKVAVAYRLFDSWDDRLLRLSEFAGIRLSQALAKEIPNLLKAEVRRASQSHHEDVQTSNLRDLARDLPASQLLDFGAGHGRLWHEWKKSGGLASATWALWEPNPQRRKCLQDEFAMNERVLVPSDLADLELQSFDAIVVANVLHECTPPQIGEIMHWCRRLLKQQGRLLVAELHPLLDPERFAVAYSREDMLRLLHKSGWLGFATSLNIRSGAISAYCISASLNGDVDNVSAASVAASVEIIWEDILHRNCAAYAGRMNFTAASSVTGCLGELAEIAAINAYRQQIWR